MTLALFTRARADISFAAEAKALFGLCVCWFVAALLIGLATMLIAALSAPYITVWSAVVACIVGPVMGLIVGAWWALRRERRLARERAIAAIGGAR